MISIVKYENFKILREVQIALDRFTVIAGPNACGKTSALRGVELLTEIQRVEPKELFVGWRTPEKLLTHGSGSTRVVGQTTKGDEYGFTIQRPLGHWDFDVIPPPPSFASGFTGPLKAPPTRQPPPRAELLHLMPGLLAEPSFDALSDHLRFNGTNLASVLASIAVSDPRGFQHLNAAVNAVIPDLLQIRMTPLQSSQVSFVQVKDNPAYYETVSELRNGFEIVADTRTAPKLSAHSLSEGTMLTIAVMTVLLFRQHPDVLLLDNLETGLHPKALGEFVSQLRKVLQQNKELQIIVTTHSPYLLDHFQPEEIRLMCLDAEGFAVCGSLTEHPDFERWKEEMLPGEFWSSVGEQWLLDKAAAKK